MTAGASTDSLSLFQTLHLETPHLFKSLTSLLYHIEHFRWKLEPTFKRIPKRRTVTEMAFLLLLFSHSYHLIFDIIVLLCVRELKRKIHLRTAP